MKHYLLFDSGCSLCTQLARDIEQEAQGKLEARSLRDAEIRGLLDDAYPGWRWEPMILEVGPKRTKKFSGVTMALQLTRMLGVGRALRVARMVRQLNVSPSHRGSGRRQMLKGAGGLLTGLLLGGTQYGKSAAQEGDTVFLPLVQSPSAGELYGGFLLLSEGAPVPREVIPEEFGFPAMCGVYDETTGESGEIGQGGAVQVNLPDVETLANDTNAPAYILNNPDGIVEFSSVLSLIKLCHRFVS